MGVVLSKSELLVTILAIVGGTILTRFLPFIIFPPGKAVPIFVQRLQFLLPSAAIGLLVVYCLKDVNLLSGNRGLPELFAVVGIVLLHRLFKNTLLSIAGGTVFYMFLVQIMF